MYILIKFNDISPEKSEKIFKAKKALADAGLNVMDIVSEFSSKEKKWIINEDSINDEDDIEITIGVSEDELGEQLNEESEEDEDSENEEEDDDEENFFEENN